MSETAAASPAARIAGWARSGEAPFYLVVAAVYLLFRGGSFGHPAVRVTDTPTYERTSDASLVSADFWAGERPFTVPFVWKLVSSDEARTVAHLALSSLGWLVLAAAVAACLQTRGASRLGFAIVLLFATTTEIILWDTLLLSESVSLSLLALVLATWLLLLRRADALGVGAVLAATLLWTFARDSHAYLVLIAAAVALASLVRPAHRPLKAALAAGSVVIFVLSVWSANEGVRWYQPMRDILLNRVAADPEMTGFFERRLGPNWRDADARRVYARYLLTHPGYTFGDPFFGSQTTPFSSSDSASALLDPDLTIYNDNAANRPLPLPGVVDNVAYVHGKVLVIVLAVLVAAAAAVVWLRLGLPPPVAVPAVAVLSTIPHGLVAYHLSGLEVDRHALEVAVLLRLATLMLALFVVDALLTARARGRVPADAAQVERGQLSPGAS